MNKSFNRINLFDLCRRYWAIALTSIYLALLTNTIQAAGRIFYDGFENGTTDAWTQDDFHNKCTAVKSAPDGTGPHSGSYQAQCNWNGTVAWNDPEAYRGLEKSISYNNEFFLRYWVRYDSDVDSKPGAKVGRLSASSQFEIVWGAQLEQSGWPMWVGVTANAAYDNDTSGLAGFNNHGWHKIEIYVKEASNGVVKFWIDDVLNSTFTGNTTGANFQPYFMMSNWSSNPGWEHDANNHVLHDDVEIYSDAASGASGSMADGTIGENGVSGIDNSAVFPAPPSAPTNIQ